MQIGDCSFSDGKMYETRLYPHDVSLLRRKSRMKRRVASPRDAQSVTTRMTVRPKKKGLPPSPNSQNHPLASVTLFALRTLTPHPSFTPRVFFFCNVKRYLPLVVATLPRRVLPTRIIPGRYPSRKRLGKNGRKFLISTACTRVPSTSLLHDKKN